MVEAIHQVVNLRMCILVLVLTAFGMAARASSDATEPIRLHPGNPHYFEWRGKPTILITSAEHYGAVLNRDFDYRRYLAALARYGFNLTRVFSGSYCEPPGAFGIANNTLAPAAGKLLCPWARSEKPGYAGGGNKFDLNEPDRAYFYRVRDFVSEAGKRGIVVELVFFCTFYDDSMWNLSPMNARNNVNGIGDVRRSDVFTLEDRELTAVQDAMVRRIVRELNEFDNLYYEICNEPYERGGQTPAWQAHVAQVVIEAEEALPHKHLIAQGLPWRAANLPKGPGGRVMPNRHVSILNFHGASPPKPVSLYYDLNKVIAYDETGGRVASPDPYRIEGWDFIISGGAVYDHLDLSFTVGNEDGNTSATTPGGGGPELRSQLAILRDFMRGFDFVRMKPDDTVVEAGASGKATVHALVDQGRAYAIYVNGGFEVALIVNLPAGTYRADWVNTRTGAVDRKEQFTHTGGGRGLASPKYTGDIALRIVNADYLRD
ncbi:MAG: hypothetical protein JSW47_10200 [Phycisphaerales bacterium]|nr:MAG: hypothetical protein JSW47_10200 [Phycisphaerales bacterium]